MSKEELKRRIIPILARHEVCRAALFGSVARGDATAESDIDLLVEFVGDKSLLDLAGLKIDLEELLGKKCDVLTYDSLNPLLKDYILRDVETII